MDVIKVLVVDDSAVVRKFIADVLEKPRDIQVVATALDPFIAADKINRFHPDVITLDIEMPRMDGLTFLEKIMKTKPIPVIMISSLTEKGARETIRAMQLGAVDFMLKPELDTLEDNWDVFSEMLQEKIRIAAKARVKRKSAEQVKIFHERHRAVSLSPKKIKPATGPQSNFIVAIGASTGGTEVISEILAALPSNFPGVVITQHMPPYFTKAFADRINSFAKLTVKEGEHGDRICNGCAFIAPGGKQMAVRKSGEGFWIEVNDDPPVNRHKPSVDVLFHSVVRSVGKQAMGILLTGMGRDGADGLLEMYQAGMQTIAQDEASSVIFGMPREAIELGAAVYVKNIEQIINHLLTGYTLR